MSAIDEYGHLWDGSEPGWRLQQTDFSVHHITFRFPVEGPTHTDVVALRGLLDELRDKPMQEIWSELRGCRFLASIRGGVGHTTRCANSMALPSKNRRNIHVDDIHYHWQFNSFRRLENDAFVVIQHASGVGPKLRIQWVGLIQPQNVRAAIQFAASLGWSHDVGDDIEIGVDSFAEPATFHQCPDDAGRYWFFDKWFGENPDRIFNSPMPGFKSET